MKSFVALSLLLPVLVAAHAPNARHVQHARQDPASASSPAAAVTTTTVAAAPATQAAASAAGATTTTAAAAAPVSSGAPGATTTSTISALPNVSFSLESTNPTAVPLVDITSGASSMPTVALDTTYAAGAQPTLIPGAPPLPNAALLVPANYPALDKSPPLDSPEVQQWIKDVANSGVTIPDIPINNPGGCPNNTINAATCWWTCGGCTRATDVVNCPDKMTWGLTYDDGPSYHTPELMNYMDSQGIKGTFFVVGSRAISFPQTLQSQYMGGHQISVHTWSHPALTTQTNEQIIAELGWSKKILKDVLGVTPNTMRPPYGDIDDRVRAISEAMGLTPVIWTRISPTATFDTDDYNIAGGLVSVSQVLSNWETIIGNASVMETGFIVLEHDLFQQTVDVATGYILPDAQAHKFNIMPVVTCLNKPLSDAYIETNNNVTNPPGSAVTLSSGAPGSAQATGAVSKSDASALSLPGLVGSIAGAIAGLGALVL